MKQQIKHRKIKITDCLKQFADFEKLFQIFKLTLKPDMQFREFKAYYFSNKLEYIDVTFMLLDETVIGFCAAAFYSSLLNNKRYTIGRAATGILPGYRGNTLPKWKLYKKYIRYRYTHLFRHCILSAYVANPLIYAMICKYTGIAYPKPETLPPPGIVRIKDALLRGQHLHLKEGPPFVVEIHFCVSIGKSEQERIFSSKDGAVNYYLKINPKFMQQHGVLVIIPVTTLNIMLTIFKFVCRAYTKAVKKIKFSFAQPESTVKETIKFR